MISLTTPHPDALEAWRDCLEDFGTGPKDGSGFFESALEDTSPTAFKSYLRTRLESEDPGVAPPEGRVHCSFRWITEDDGRILGFIAIRHELNDFLLNEGGHIGYSVRPSARRRGVATAALAQALALAGELGIRDVLVTCAEENLASRTVLESSAGRYEDSRNGTRRYWFTAP